MPLRSVRRAAWAERRRAKMVEVPVLDKPKKAVKAVPVVEKPARKKAKK